MQNQITFSIIISTCEKYSDLWDINFELFHKHWPDCPANVYLLTDSPTDRSFEGVEIIAAGEGTEITERLAKALEMIRTEYVLFILEDHFLIKPIDNSDFEKALRFMKEYHMDYTRLYTASKHYLRREGAVRCEAYPDFYFRNLDKGDYKVSLYPGLWSADFMRKTLKERLNAWQYEVSLTPLARELNAKCAICNRDILPILDVICKGKLFHKANRYLKHNGYELPSRELIGRKEEIRILGAKKLRHIMPLGLIRKTKKALSKKGFQFYSDSDSLKG